MPISIICVNSALATLNFSGASRRDLVMNKKTGGRYMVRDRVKQSFLVKRRFGNICKFFKSLQNVGFSSMLAPEGDKGNPLRTEPDDLTFVKRLLISTRRPYLGKKSAPNMVFSTSANTKIWVKTRFKPKLRVRHLWSYVWMGNLLTAWRVNLWKPLFLSSFVAGIMDICAPLSTRKLYALGMVKHELPA